MPFEMILARVEAAEGSTVEARARLRAIVSEARTKGIVSVELDAGLALAEIEHAAGGDRAALVGVEREARRRGFGLVARLAAAKRR
jgi:hypothetical protein